MKKHRIRKLSVSELRETEGKIRTEELFVRDMRLALMFVKYLRNNAKYLKRYEEDKSAYDGIIGELDSVKRILKSVDKAFKEHQEEL